MAVRVYFGVVKALIVALIVIGVILVAVGGWAVGVYNELVGLQQGVNEKWVQVQNVFQRRADLADLSVTFGKSTTARIRHLEAKQVTEAAAALGRPAAR